MRIISSDDTFAGFTDEVRVALQAKHPPAPAGLGLPPPPDATTAPFQATKEQVLEALRSFKPGSGAGPDGLRPGHIQSLTSKGSGTAGERLKNSITSLCNLICRGEVPEKVQPVLYGATLCALSKKDGGIRTIAVGTCLRRLATKVLMRSITPEIREALQPTQLGVGTPAGCEAATHAVRHYINPSTTPKVILKIDLKNAFNTIRRETILHQRVNDTQGYP